MDDCETCKKCGTNDCIGTADGCYEPAPNKIPIWYMLQEIQNEANIQDVVGDTEWIVDTYNHLFGTDYNINDY